MFVGKTLRVIANGCEAAAVKTTLLSASKFSNENVRFKYDSFSFAGLVDAQKQSITCDLQFCLTKEIETKCAITCED